MGDWKLYLIFFLGVILSFAAVYQISSSKVNNELLRMEGMISEKEAELASLSREHELPSVTGEINCLICHDLLQTKGFHVSETIMRIDERSGKRRRICIDCHGPNSFDSEGRFLGWNAEMQMTPLDMISFDESAGVNGVFVISNKVPHAIHSRLLYDLKVISCDDCHLIDGEIKAPVVNLARGNVLVCQSCKYHPEDGNYIRIHVEDGGGGCQSCHTGNVIEIHKEKMLGLGKIS